MASTFWDSKRILLNDYIPCKNAVAEEYYSSHVNIVVGQQAQMLRDFTKSVLLPDNASVHIAQIAICDIGFKRLEYSPHSP